MEMCNFRPEVPSLSVNSLGPPLSIPVPVAGGTLHARGILRKVSHLYSVPATDEFLSINASTTCFQEAVTTVKKAKRTPSWAEAGLHDALSYLDSHLLPLPTVSEVSGILRNCKRPLNASVLSRLFIHIRTLGYDAEPCIGNDLVCMLAAAGQLSEAQQVFDKLTDRSRSCYNALITGYIKCGQPLLALHLYERLQPNELQHISRHNFVALIKACTQSKNLSLGSQIHFYVAAKDLLLEDKFLGSALVDMYGKCGSLSEAKKLFNELPIRDVVLWNAVISAYANHGHGEEALKSFWQMQHEGFKPTATTLVCCMKACGSLADLDHCQILDAEARGQGLEKDPIVGSALMEMHVKCGCLDKAEEVFYNLPVRNVVSWTSIIKGYLEHGFAEKALACFEKMESASISPDAIAFLYGIKACGNSLAFVKGHKLHADISRRGFESDLLLGCTLIDMYCKFGLLNRAQEIFRKQPTKDVMLWNTLMGGFLEFDQGEEALQLYEQMQQDGISPVAISYVFALKACGIVMSIQKGKEVHADVLKSRLDRDLLVGSSLVDMYANCGALEAAQEVFDNLSDHDVVAWTSLIGGYTDFGQGQEALTLFEQMQSEGCSPNAVTFACTLKACGNEGNLHKGQEIHAKIAKAGIQEEDSIVGNVLIDMYSKCGLAVRAQEVFEMQAIQEMVSWNALIAGYAQLGKSGAVFTTLKKMAGKGQVPNVVTFVSILNACSHAGLVDLGLMYFECMVRNYSIIPLLEHQTCMVDLFCRAGQIELALCVINDMQLNPDLAVWHTFLTACKKGSYVDLGKQAFEHAVQRNRHDVTTYISVSNIFYDNDDVG